MTNRTQRWLPAFALSLLVASAVGAVRAPVAVSPGDGSRVAAISTACPTFSWGGEAAGAYELVVYEVDDRRPGRALPAAPVVRRRLPGAARSWTPNRSGCFAAGRTFGWSIRAAGAEGWSEPRFFRVDVATSPVEVEDALTVLRRYLAERGVAGAEVVAATVGATAGERTPRTTPRRPAGVDRGEPLAARPVPMSHGSGPEFSIGSGGLVTAHAFSGDGSGLTGVNASSLQGSSPSSFASSGHSHQLSELTVGTGAGPALVAPTVTSCSGTPGTSSSCTATCASGVMIGGGCANVTPSSGTPCAATGSAVHTSRPSAVAESWDCEVVCVDGTSSVEALGEVLCSETVP